MSDSRPISAVLLGIASTLRSGCTIGEALNAHTGEDSREHWQAMAYIMEAHSRTPNDTAPNIVLDAANEALKDGR